MHIKENKLQTENDKRTIHLDPALKELFPRATDPFSMYEITRYIKDHIILNTPTIEKKSPSE